MPSSSGVHALPFRSKRNRRIFFVRSPNSFLGVVRPGGLLRDLGERRVGVDRPGQGGELHPAVDGGDPFVDQFPGVMPGDLASQKRPRRADQHLDLSPGLPFGKRAVHVAEVGFEDAILHPCRFRPLLVQADARHLGIGVRAPRDLRIVRFPRQPEHRVRQGDPRLVPGHVGERKDAVHVPARIDVGNVRPHPPVGRNPARGERDTRRGKLQPLHVRFSPGRHQEDVPLDCPRLPFPFRRPHTQQHRPVHHGRL